MKIAIIGSRGYPYVYSGYETFESTAPFKHDSKFHWAQNTVDSGWTAAGRIAELIINIGIPGGLAFKIGSGLTKATLRAKQAGTYLSGKEKLKRFGKGALAGGVAEGVFVGDVEEAGTFGDLIGGPTEMDRGLEGTDYDPGRELLNRLK